MLFSHSSLIGILLSETYIPSKNCLISLFLTVQAYEIKEPYSLKIKNFTCLRDVFKWNTSDIDDVFFFIFSGNGDTFFSNNSSNNSFSDEVFDFKGFVTNLY